MRLKAFAIFSISIIFLLNFNLSVFAEEKITLSTYYPAPIAEYYDLEAEKSFTAGEENTTSDPFTNITPFYGDLVILPQNQEYVYGLEGGNVGIGTDAPTAKLEVVGGAIKATDGLIIETRTDTPTALAAGQLWLRTDIEESGVEGSLVWTKTSNPSAGFDIAYSITSDADYLYIAGADLSGGNAQWRIEKYSKDGVLQWARTSNPSAWYDVPFSITSDDDYIYVAGYDNSPGNAQWRIEKRSKLNGDLIWPKTSNPSSGVDYAYSITSDNDYIYVAGYDRSVDTGQFRIEKYSKDGVLQWAKTSNPSIANDIAYSITSDNDYLYVAGTTFTPVGLRQRIEKYNKSGGMIWGAAVGNNGYTPRSITCDDDYLYTAGWGLSAAPSDYKWRIEKHSKDGIFKWTKTSNPSAASDVAYAIICDDDYLYIAGGTNWRVEKYNKNGIFLWERIVGNAFAGRSITSDNDYLYIAGERKYPTGSEWYIEKRSKGGGYIDIGLRAYNGTGIIVIACEPDDGVSSALRIVKDNKVYGIILVDTTDPNASSIRIRTSSGTKALRKL